MMCRLLFAFCFSVPFLFATSFEVEKQIQVNPIEITDRAIEQEYGKDNLGDGASEADLTDSGEDDDREKRSDTQDVGDTDTVDMIKRAFEFLTAPSADERAQKKVKRCLPWSCYKVEKRAEIENVSDKDEISDIDTIDMIKRAFEFLKAPSTDERAQKKVKRCLPWSCYKKVEKRAEIENVSDKDEISASDVGAKTNVKRCLPWSCKKAEKRADINGSQKDDISAFDEYARNAMQDEETAIKRRAQTRQENTSERKPVQKRCGIPWGPSCRKKRINSQKREARNGQNILSKKNADGDVDRRDRQQSLWQVAANYLRTHQ